jgi:hypothetical protein
MPVATVGLIIAGVIAAASAITTSAMNNKAQKEAGKESKSLALIARDDELSRQHKEFGLAEEKLKLDKVKTNFEIEQTRKATKATQLGTLTNTLNINSQKDQNMTNFILSLYGNKAGR